MTGQTIRIDHDADGRGWFVDSSPQDHSEFALPAGEGKVIASPGSQAYGRMDLLSAVTHEIGHILGFDHADSDQWSVMDDRLETGVRHLTGQTSITVQPPPDNGLRAPERVQIVQRSRENVESTTSRTVAEWSPVVLVRSQFLSRASSWGLPDISEDPLKLPDNSAFE